MSNPRTISGQGFNERIERYVDLIEFDMTFDHAPTLHDLVAATMFYETRSMLGGVQDLCGDLETIPPVANDTEAA